MWSLVISLFTTLITYHVIILHKMGIPLFAAPTFPTKLPSPLLLTSPVFLAVSLRRLMSKHLGGTTSKQSWKAVFGLKTDLFHRRLFSCEQHFFSQNPCPEIWIQLSPGGIKQCNEQKINLNEAIKLLAKSFPSCLVNMLNNYSLNRETKATKGFTISSSDGDRSGLIFVYRNFRSNTCNQAVKHDCHMELSGTSYALFQAFEWKCTVDDLWSLNIKLEPADWVICKSL